MRKQYLNLATQRYATRPGPFKNPEDLGFDFRRWISPYTKCAHTIGDIAIVLQDWGSVHGFRKIKPEVRRLIQETGRNPYLRTNTRLDFVLEKVFGKHIGDVYITNAFPYVKPGSMSSRISMSTLKKTVVQFTIPELELANPKKIFVCGAATFAAISGVCAGSVLRDRLIKVPHPAARIDTRSLLAIWEKAAVNS